MRLSRLLLIWLAVMMAGCAGKEEESEFGVLVPAEWLEAQMKDPSLVIMHVGTEELYDSIHIPGARYMDPYDFTHSTDSLRNEIPALDTIENLLRSAGVNRDSRIVLYYEDQGWVSRTTRVFLALDYAGLGDRTSVLNGGLPGWVEEERKITDVVPDPVSGDLTLGEYRDVIIRARELDRQRWNPAFVIVDTRSPGEYYGEIDSTDQTSAGGHIEGAYFMNYGTVLSDTEPDRFKGDDELKQEFDRIGMDPERTMVVYCGSGVRASVSYLAARHLGYRVKLYDGSYQEWEELDLPLTSPAIAPSDQP